MLAPTGNGKTLAAFLWALDRLSRTPKPEKRGVRVLYISPLKALAYDVEKNLRAPLDGIQRTAEALGTAVHAITVGIRTGDTPQSERAALQRRPPDVLVTTPESLYLMLLGHASAMLETVEHVIIDEIHSVAGTKRGAHLAISLERLSALCQRDPQRIGLSATVAPIPEIAGYLGGDRLVQVIDALAPPRLTVAIDLPDRTVRPVADGTEAGPVVPQSPSIWPALEVQVRGLLEGQRSVIVFVNNRGASERLAQELNDRAGSEIALAHHGSLSRARREAVEERLKSGQIRAIVATSSLELGIDMGTVDRVIQIDSPGAVSRGLQRIGRAGHGVGQTSDGVFIAKHRGELVECVVVAEGMAQGLIEATVVTKNALDVLAQHVVAMVSKETVTVPAVLAIVRRAYGYRRLSEAQLHGVLDMLSGRYPSTDFADLRPRLTWDRTTQELTARRGARLLAVSNAGTIPDRGTYAVHLAPDGPRVGELDEEMVYEARPGQTFVLGATTWRIESITRDRVLVSPAPGEPGGLPFWKGAGPGRPIELGRSVGAFLRAFEARLDEDTTSLIGWLETSYRLSRRAAIELLAYLRDQKSATGRFPTDRVLVVERFRDEIGDLRVCILTPYGNRVHAPWAMALEAAFSREAGFKVTTIYSDDGIALRFADGEASLAGGAARWVPDPDEITEIVIDQLADTALFAGTFRENAGRALLLPRRGPERRTPLWAQRLKSQTLMAVAKDHPQFPIMLETYRTCLDDTFDMPALRAVLESVRSGETIVHEVTTERASPFARSLVFATVAAWLYEDDAPIAERRSQALTLDRELLRDLLGTVELRELLDLDAIAAVEAELQGRAESYRARDAEELNDRLRRVGDLSAVELAERSTLEDPTPWIEVLVATGRVIEIRIAGEVRWVVGEDVGLFRDLPGAVVPDASERRADALREIITRFAHTHGPFTSRELARRYGLLPVDVEPWLERSLARGRLVVGQLRPGGTEREWCDSDVLKCLRRRTLAALKDELSPVAPAVFARFLLDWHAIQPLLPGKGRTSGSAEQLLAVITRLEGLALPISELETRILPVRVPGFAPADLDELVALGQVVWVGAGSLGVRDGRARLVRRERAALVLPDVPDYDPATPLHAALLAQLERRGACFLVELKAASGGAPLTEVVGALVDLIAAGQITNDTLQPLRTLRSVGKPRTERQATQAAGGRWSLVRTLLEDRPSATARVHAQATLLLGRHGIVSRETNEIEDIPGGFGSLYPVLRGFDEVGAARRGYFVHGISGVQFAASGAVDRLRAAREASVGVLVLAACDPANPWGATLPWPTLATGEEVPLTVATEAEAAAEAPRRLRRDVGASVVFVDGVPWFYLSRSGKQLTAFAEARSNGNSASWSRALTALAAAHLRVDGAFTVEEIDGERVSRAPYLAALTTAGFEVDPKGLLYERQRARPQSGD